VFGVDGNELAEASGSTPGSLELVGEKCLNLSHYYLFLESATPSSC
jgi:hypothetical protein